MAQLWECIEASSPLQEVFIIALKPIPWKIGGLQKTIEEASIWGVSKYSVGYFSDNGNKIGTPKLKLR